MPRTLSWLVVAMISLRAALVWCDDAPSGNPVGSDDARTSAADIDDTLDASEADGAEIPSKKSHWNEIDLKLLTVRIGGGVGFDWATYEQDAASAAQMPVQADEKLRDFRFLLKGRFLFWSRLSYTLGYMYDGPTQTWRFRQTGLMLDVPELSGQLFVGRTKEGISASKIMVGYNTWTLERAAVNEAFLPILADGVKWTAQAFGNRLVYNVGWFGDQWSETESFNKNDRQFVGRAVWLPFAKSDPERVLHLGADVRFAASDDGSLQYKAKPEAFPAQSFAVDTGKFPAANATTVGAELYYRPGPLMFGSEYFFNKVSSSETNNPLFHGGEAFVAYLFTGELRPYNERGAFFEAVTPSHSVFAGGLGAWELVVRGSYVDLDSGTITGGKFARITPVINWYLSSNVRLEAEYGYSWLDKLGSTETTQYVQSRLQITLM